MAKSKQNAHKVQNSKSNSYRRSDKVNKSKKTNYKNGEYGVKNPNIPKVQPENMNSSRDSSKYINRVMGTDNHPSWYTRNPQLIEDASKISWFQQLGAKVDFGNGTNNHWRVPGLCVLHQVTCPGYSEGPNDPASLAGLQVYEYIRTCLNKPNPDYEPQDTQMYILAVDDIFSQYVNGLRLFGIANTFSGDNLYTPRSLMYGGYGFSEDGYNDFIANQANYRARFNTLIYKASSFLYYPEAFTITDRHSWLFGNIFMDHDSNKAQYYMYRKHNFWKFDETGSDQGTQLIYQEYTNRGVTNFGEYLNMFDECIEALRSSTLVRTLVTDMRQAFNDTNVLNMGYVDERYTITPSYDSEALMQIENIDVVPSWNDFSRKNVTQIVDSNVLYYAPWIASNVASDVLLALGANKIINTHTRDTDVNTLVEATRGMVTITASTSGGTAGYTIVPATDFTIDLEFYGNPDDLSNFGNVRFNSEGLVLHIGAGEAYGSTTDLDEVLRTWSAFDWAPKFWLADGQYCQPVLEWDHYTVVGDDVENSVIRRLNTACLLSTWSIPELGTFKP